MDIQKILDEFGKSEFTNVSFVEGLVHAKPVYQYDLEGNIIQKHPSLTYANKEYNLQNISISNHKKIIIFKDYIWSLDENLDKQKIRDFVLKRNEALLQQKSKPVGKFNLDNTLIKVYDSLYKAATDNHLNKSSLKKKLKESCANFDSYLLKYL